MASASKYWLNLDCLSTNAYTLIFPALIFNQNLECASTSFLSNSWNNLVINYGLSQTSVDYLWSMIGLISNEHFFKQKTIK